MTDNIIFHKYPKIRSLGHEDIKDIFENNQHDIIIEEKIDGGNFRFMINNNNEIIFGSRTQELDDKSEKFKNSPSFS